MEYEADKRLAQLLIRSKAVTVDELAACAEIQRDEKAHGRRPPGLGWLLIERGAIEERRLSVFTRAATPPTGLPLGGGALPARGAAAGHPPAPPLDGDGEGRPAVPSASEVEAGAVDAPFVHPRLRHRRDRHGRPFRSIGGYDLVHPIASGGSGTVFKGRDRETGELVAVKVLSAKGSQDGGTARFLREAHVACRLRHANLVHGITVGTDDGLYYFVMELVEGRSVGDQLRRFGRFGEAETIVIALGVARALECARRHRIVHRDIKPDNIVLAASGGVKLCDLGLARPFGMESGVTTSGITVGTPRYISPEQARGQKDVDHRSDIYSLGITLWHMVVGEAPFQGDSGIDVLSKHIYEDVPSIRDRRRDVSLDLDRIVRRMTRKRREERYQAAEDLVRDLEELAHRLG